MILEQLVCINKVELGLNDIICMYASPNYLYAIFQLNSGAHKLYAFDFSLNLRGTYTIADYIDTGTIYVYNDSNIFISYRNATSPSAYKTYRLSFDGSSFTEIADNNVKSSSMQYDGSVLYIISGLNIHTYNSSLVYQSSIYTSVVSLNNILVLNGWVHAAIGNEGIVAIPVAGGSNVTKDDGGNYGSVSTDGTYIFASAYASGMYAYSFNGSAYTLLSTLPTAGSYIWGIVKNNYSQYPSLGHSITHFVEDTNGFGFYEMHGAKFDGSSLVRAGMFPGVTGSPSFVFMYSFHETTHDRLFVMYPLGSSGPMLCTYIINHTNEIVETVNIPEFRGI